MFQHKNKIQNVVKEGDYQDNAIYLVTFDNGEQRKLFTKSVPPAIGTELEYNVTAKGNISLALPRDNFGGGGFGQKKSFGGGSYNNPAKDALIVRQVALKAAVEFAAIHNLKTDDVLKVAVKFNDWMMEETKAEASNVVSSQQNHFAPAAAPAAPVQTNAVSSNATSDDLPF